MYMYTDSKCLRLIAPPPHLFSLNLYVHSSLQHLCYDSSNINSHLTFLYSLSIPASYSLYILLCDTILPDHPPPTCKPVIPGTISDL